jgi:sigma-B regulation protein RsbU (phosphoserine phosphatase)
MARTTIDKATLDFRPLDSKERAFTLSGDGPLGIGRAADSDIQLDDPAVSRHHAVFTRRGDAWCLAPHVTLGGTFLNGVTLAPGTAVLLSEGDLLRLGPCTFRARGRDAAVPGQSTADIDVAPGTIIEAAPDTELESLDHRRLQLIMEGSAAMHDADDESDLVEAIMELTLQGTGFGRAVILRPTGEERGFDVVASRDPGRAEGAPLAFSRTLASMATEGNIVRLTRKDLGLGASIGALAIHSAVCCPITLDSAVVSLVYLDSRGDEPVTRADADAGAFTHAAARLAGLALARLKRAELRARQDRLEKDLAAARQAQETLGPPDTATIGRLHYAKHAEPGHFVAGDLFDIFDVGDGLVAICLGDVTGHDVRSAILMSAVLSHVHAIMNCHHDPVAAANHVNRYLCERTELNLFVTLFVAVFDARESTLRYVDGGHGLWMTKRAGADPALAPRTSSLVLGIDPGQEYRSDVIELGPGDRIVLYTDGVVERRGGDDDDEEFGQERLREIVAGSDSAAADVERGVAALREFAGSATAADDTTLVSIELLPAGSHGVS